MNTSFICIHSHSTLAISSVVQEDMTLGHHQNSMTLYADDFLHAHAFYYKHPPTSTYLEKAPK